MPELRKNNLTGEWVSIAADRAKRPMQFKMTADNETSENECAFCAGNRHMVPKPFYESPDGEILAIPNKYPILSNENPLGYGQHEVIVDTKEHTKQMHLLETSHVADVLDCIKTRILENYKDEKIKYVQVFKNNGVDAGATISHSHWQLLAMPIIPQRQEVIFHNARGYFSDSGKNYFDELIKTMDGELKILENEDFLSFVPYAAKFSYEINIVTKKNTADFADFTRAEILSLADILKKSLTALLAVLPKTNYNLCFYSSPKDKGDLNGSYSFWMQIIPRSGRVAGCEFSTGMFTCSVYPEDASRELRERIL